MSKELEALEALSNIKRESGIPYFSTLYDIDMWREDFAIVEKALKAFEILKNRFDFKVLDDGKNYETLRYISGELRELLEAEIDEKEN